MKLRLIAVASAICMLAACQSKDAPVKDIGADSGLPAPTSSQNAQQRNMAVFAVQDYFQQEGLAPTEQSATLRPLPANYTAPARDGWVADWGIWADLSDEAARELYKNIPKDLALKYSFGSPDKEIVIFTDPYSQDDRRLYRFLGDAEENMNATVYVYLLPGKVEVGNVQRILCSANPEKAWWEWMMQIAPSRLDAASVETPRMKVENEARVWEGWKRQFPEMLSCEHRSRGNEIAELATELGVSHTPTLIFANGRAWPSPIVNWQDVQDNWSYVHGRLKIPLSSSEKTE